MTVCVRMAAGLALLTLLLPCSLPLLPHAQNFAGVDKYVEALLEARKGKNMTRDVAIDAVTGDVNMFGVMMVALGDAGGMVSGSIHTTAATIRPAMQVLKTPNLVSSVFFMCLPDKVRARGGVCAHVGWGVYLSLSDAEACSDLLRRCVLRRGGGYRGGS